MPLNKNKKSILELETVAETWKLEALRVMMDIAQDTNDDMLSERRELVSLEEIFLTTKDNNSPQEESYIMLAKGEDKDEEKSRDKDLILVVKRSKLIFNDKECHVINFQDVTTAKRLKE